MDRVVRSVRDVHPAHEGEVLSFIEPVDLAEDCMADQVEDGGWVRLLNASTPYSTVHRLGMGGDPPSVRRVRIQPLLTLGGSSMVEHWLVAPGIGVRLPTT